MSDEANRRAALASGFPDSALVKAESDRCTGSRNWLFDADFDRRMVIASNASKLPTDKLSIRARAAIIVVASLNPWLVAFFASKVIYAN
jgi:hypothetical protein